MTTIAIDKYTVAADGMTISGREVVSTDEIKIRRVPGGVIYALTGCGAVFDAAVDWHQSGADPEKAPFPKHDDDHWSLIVVSREKVSMFTRDCPYASEFPKPQAFGSGSDYATAAMACGKSAREAVEIASKLDVFTGGEIIELSIDFKDQIAAE